MSALGKEALTIKTSEVIITDPLPMSIFLITRDSALYGKGKISILGNI